MMRPSDTSLHPSFSSKGLNFSLSLLPAALGLCLLFSFLASLWIPILSGWTADGSTWKSLLGMGGYLSVFSALYLVLRKCPPYRETTTVTVLILCSTLLKVGLVCFSSTLPVVGDQGLFHWFATSMADSRLDGGVMSALSTYYDYPNWAGRVMPFQYLLRLWSDAEDLFWLRLLNTGISTLLLFEVYSLSKDVLPKGKRTGPVFLLAVLPYQSLLVTDYSHHLFATLYFLTSVWAANRLLFHAPPLKTRIALSLLIGLCLLLMVWQRGTHLIVLGLFLCLWLWQGWAGRRGKQWLELACWLFLLPMLIALPLASLYDQWLDQFDRHQLNSGIPAFLARGWCPESGGEYRFRYEQLDAATPPGKKTSAMLRLPASQFRSNPLKAAGLLPLVKTTKFFLVGYAASYEEALTKIQSAALPWVQGIRRMATILFTGLALWGCLMLGTGKVPYGTWVLVLLAPLLVWAAYVVLGETSPRYSIFCHPFLAILGGLALSRNPFPAHGQWPWTAFAAFFLRMGILLVAAGLFFAAAVAGVRWIPSHRLYADLQAPWTASGRATVAPGRLLPFETRLEFPAESDHGEVEWTLPAPLEKEAALTFYILSANEPARSSDLVIYTQDTPTARISLQGVDTPRWVDIPASAGLSCIRFSLASNAVAPVPALPRTVDIGYVTFSANSP